jgi:hypothetical protein
MLDLKHLNAEDQAVWALERPSQKDLEQQEE